VRNIKESTTFGLLELIEKQQEIINNQHEALASLVNENAEQEAIINELMRGE